MKKYMSLGVFALLISVAGQAQYAISLTHQYTFTVQQVDSILVAQIGSLASSAFTPVYGVKTYKVSYNTYDVDSIPTTASGLLVVPMATPCEVPILSFQHNNIIRKADAPSRYNANSQWFIGLAAASLGNITLLPDGIGLGDGPGLHPFLHLQSEATSVIDMIRAVKETVDSTGASPNEQLFLAGISEGAYASLAAHQYLQTYLDSTLHVTASAGIAGYYDMSGTMVNMILTDSVYADPSYLPELLLGYNKAYHFFTSDSDIFAYPYDSIIPPLFNGNNRGSTIDTRLPGVAKYMMRQDQIDSLQNDPNNYLRQLLAKNDVYNWSPTSPVNLLYCNADEYVPFQNSIVAYTHFVQNGSNMADTLNIGAALDHAECAQFSVLSAISLITSLVHQPLATQVTATAPSSATAADGSATVNNAQGDPPYTWRWSNGDSTASITGLTAGTYYVTTTDRALCTSIDSAVLTFSNGISEIALSHIYIYPNPTQGMLLIENKSLSEKIAQVEALDISGDVISAPQTQSGNTIQIDMGGAAKGIYFINIRAQSGKEMHTKVVLM